jgi:hypothetical protein
MEYVSIPWENHKRRDSDHYNSLTVNLALWFVHILAGNAHEVGWSYPDLWEEQLTTGACAASRSSDDSESEPDSEASEPPQKQGSLRLGSHSRKRRRDSDVSDGPHYSFAAAFESFATQVRFHLSHKTLSVFGMTLILFIVNRPDVRTEYIQFRRGRS